MTFRSDMKLFTKVGLDVFEYYRQIKDGERKARLEDMDYVNSGAFQVDHVDRQMSAFRHQQADIEQMKLEAETDWE